MAQERRTRKTYCRICEAACGLLAEQDEAGHVLRILPDRNHPVSQGYVCAKGTRFLEVAAHSQRMRHPEVRQPDGTYQRVSWEDAIAQFASRVTPVLEQYGPHAVGVYYGNPVLFNALGLVSMLSFTRAIGTRNVFSSFSQDCNNKFAGAELVHDGALVHPIPDLEQADFALMLGTNPAVSQGSFVHLSGGASAFDRYAARGGRVVWVDPRRTESARRWGEHLPIRPGTDVFLLLALLHELRDLAQPSPHVVGLEELLTLAAQYPADATAVLTNIPAGRIRNLARQIREANAATFQMSVGVNQGPFGTLSYVAMQALAYVSGNFDSAGGLLFHPLGPVLSGVLRHVGIGVDAPPSRSGAVGVLSELPGGVLADEILTPGPERIRVLINLAGNPLKSIPGAPRLREALEQLDYLVHIDLFANDTGRLADLRLPATSWLERWDLATTTGVFQKTAFLQYGGPVQAPPGEARPERRILADLSLALERPLFRRRRLARWWGHWPLDRALTSLLDALTFPYRLGKSGAQGLPAPRPRADSYLHGRRQVHFWRSVLAGEAERLAATAREIEAMWGGTAVSPNGSDSGSNTLLLVCRRRRLGHNSWLHGALHDGRSESAAWLSPADMANLHLAKGDSLTLHGNGASITLPVLPKPDVAPGTVIVPHGLPDANVNALIPSGAAMVEPLSGNHLMTGVPVRASRAVMPAQEASHE